MSQYLLGIIFALSMVLRILFVSNFNFAFTIDQARDMLEVRKIVVGHDPVFIGPVTSLNGVYLGPFWFYFNIIPFLIGAGDPSYHVYWQIIIFHFSIFVFWRYFKNRNSLLAFWGSLFLLLSPRLIEASSYSFNANTTPSFLILDLVLLCHCLSTKNKFHLLLLGLLVGLTIQIEAAFGVIIFPLALTWLLLSKVPFKKYYFLGFLVTLTPQLLFELKNKFIMTNVFISEFAGKSDILGDKLSLFERLTDRFQNYYGSLLGSFPVGRLSLLAFILTISIFIYKYLYKNDKLSTNKFLAINLSLIITSLIFFMIYPGRLKDWWTINLSIPYLLTVASLPNLLDRKSKMYRVGITLFLILLTLNTYSFIHRKYIERTTTRSDDKALLLNQIEAIDTVYKLAQGNGFKVYNFAPAVYDYNYQYLFWWYGYKKYGYLPEVITYEDNVPNYIDVNPRFDRPKKDSNGSIFLIAESASGFEAKEESWRSKFKAYCQESSNKLTGNITVEKLTQCPKNR